MTAPPPRERPGRPRPERAAPAGPRRRLALTLLLVVGCAALAAAEGDSIVVENWSKMTVGARGVPPGWQAQKWGSPRYEFAIVRDGSGKVIELKSEGDSSTISKEIKIDVKQYPILEWRWKVSVLPPRGDARRAETDDEAAQLYVSFPRFPTAVRTRVIGYIWDTGAPSGAVFPSAKVGAVTFVVVRSGPGDLGKWITESRNVYEDYKRIYREEPGETVGGVSLSINSQNTGARAESLFGEILFRKP